MAADSFVYKIVALTVFVLIAATVLVPVVQDAQDDLYSVEQNVAARYTVMPMTSDIVLTNTASEALYNGESLSGILLVTDQNMSAYVISDVALFRADYTASTQTWGKWVAVSPLFTAENYNIVSGANDTYTFSNGTFTAVNENVGTEYNYSSTYEFVIAPSDTGSLGAWLNSDLPKYVDDGSSVYYMQRFYGNSIVAHGTLENMNVDFNVDGTSIVTTTGLTATYTPTAHDASNELTGFTVSNASNNEYVVFAPIEYTVITNDQSTASSLLGIVPLMVIIAAVMIAVGLLRGKS